MLNPFIYGKVVQGGDFVNREEEVATITQTLLSGQNIICYSPRRYGKTSMMIRVGDALTAKRQLVFFIDLFRVTSIEDLYNIYASSITAVIQSPIKTLISTIQNILPSINPKIVFKSPDLPSVEISVPLPVLSKSATLHELFGSLEKYCEKKGKKGTVIFDEFQEVDAIQDGAMIQREMRSAFQHHKHVSYAFLGSKQHLLKRMFKDKNRPFYNFGRHFELDIIDTKHWRRFITRKMGAICPGECVDLIIAAAENHPYYTQMFCHYVWDYAQRHKCSIDSKILDEIIREILQRDSFLFAELWGNISIRERHLLKAIAADEPGSLYEKRFLLSHNLGTASSVQKASTKLLESDYIRNTPDKGFTFVNPFFKLWVLKNDSVNHADSA